MKAIFAFFEPIRGWRRVSVRRTRTLQDWAEEVRRLLDEDYLEAERFTLVCDYVNTHRTASLYATFPAAEADRLARKLRLVHTPRTGSWLNMAEMELGTLTRQCIGRRLEKVEAMTEQMAKWKANRNEFLRKVAVSLRETSLSVLCAHWRFSTAKPRNHPSEVLSRRMRT